MSQLRIWPRAVLRVLVVLACWLAMSSCSEVVCDEDSTEVAFARQFPQSRWERLVLDARHLKGAVSDVLGAPVGDLSSTPAELADLKPVDAKFYGDTLAVKLKGCFDHHIYLITDFHPPGTETVILQWGEGPTFGSEVLWRASGQ